MRSHWLPQTRSLGELSFQVQRFRVIEAAYVMAPPVGKAAEAKTLASIRERIDKALQTEVSLAAIRRGTSRARRDCETLARIFRVRSQIHRTGPDPGRRRGHRALPRRHARRRSTISRTNSRPKSRENVASAERRGRSRRGDRRSGVSGHPGHDGGRYRPLPRHRLLALARHFPSDRRPDRCDDDARSRRQRCSSRRWS